MSNISQNIMPESQSLSYSSSSSRHDINYERLSDSLQYLDRIRKVNQNIYNAVGKRSNNNSNEGVSSQEGMKKDQMNNENNNSNNNMLALQRLVNTNKQITYIDNDKLYGIVSVQKYNKLQSTIVQLQQLYQQSTQSQQSLRQQNTIVKQQIQQLIQKQSQNQSTIHLLQQTLKNEKQLRQRQQQHSLQLSQTLNILTTQRTNDSKLYLALQNDFQTFKYSQQPQNKRQSSNYYMMISQTQTNNIIQNINLPPFDFESNLQEIMKQLKDKQSQNMLASTQSIKKIVEQSLQTFVQQLQSQYELIMKQTIDLSQLKEKNTQLLQENVKLRQQLEEISIEESKLEIFKSCMTQFLQDTTETVTNTIESDRVKGKISSGVVGRGLQGGQQQQQQQQQGNVVNPQQEQQQPQQQQKQQLLLPLQQQNNQLQLNIEHYKKQNLKLIKTIGEYQYKWRNVQKVLQENKKQAIPDDGTVGHLVKMSKLVKQSIKNLLHQL